MVKKKQKTINTIDKKCSLSKNVTRDPKVLEDYLNTKDWQQYPLTGSKLEDLAIKLVEWAKNDPKALKIRQFSVMHDIQYDTLRKWAERYPVMKAAFQAAKDAIGNRRETEARMLPMIPDMIIKSMHTYDPEWDTINRYHAELKNQSQGIFGGSSIQVIMEPIDNSPMVPHKKDKKDDQ